MESELYRKVYQLVIEIANGRTIKKATFFDADIVLTYLWAVLHDRSIYWACNKKNWPIYYRRKPLPIRKNSKDKQAGFGPAGGLMAAGYKMHTIADSSQGFVIWTVRPMNHSEAVVAKKLIYHLNGEGYLIGDRAYDINNLYEDLSHKSIQLLTPQRIKNAKGLGHRRNSIHRIRAMYMKDTYFGRGLLESREQIERMYGQLTNLGCGLSPLPNWVRTLFRVEMWIRAKLIFYQIWRREVAPSAA
jgi:hypothetical protein